MAVMSRWASVFEAQNDLKRLGRSLRKLEKKLFEQDCQLEEKRKDLDEMEKKVEEKEKRCEEKEKWLEEKKRMSQAQNELLLILSRRESHRSRRVGLFYLSRWLMSRKLL